MTALDNMRVKSYQQILEPVRFRDWRFNVVPQKDASGVDTHYVYLQVEFDAINTDNRIGVEPTATETHRGRKWLLSPHMTEGEVVQTALMAVLAALEHEAREEFTYRGFAIFGPHYDLAVLCAVVETGHGDVRRAPREMDFGFGRKGRISDAPRKGQDHDGLLDDVEPTDPFRRER